MDIGGCSCLLCDKYSYGKESPSLCDECLGKYENKKLTKKEIAKVCLNEVCSFCENKPVWFVCNEQGNIVIFFCDECRNKLPSKKAREHLFWIQDHTILTAGDEQARKKFFERYMPQFPYWFDKDFARATSFYSSHTAYWGFPCKEKYLVSKVLKKAFLHLSQYEICKGFCPLGKFCNDCEVWEKRFKTKK